MDFFYVFTLNTYNCCYIDFIVDFLSLKYFVFIRFTQNKKGKSVEMGRMNRKKKIKSCDPFFKGKRDHKYEDNHDDAPGFKRPPKNPQKKTNHSKKVDKKQR